MLIQLPVEQFQNLCRNTTTNKDQIITAMIQACKSSVKRLEHSKVIKLLKTLRDKKIGTNEVEYTVNRACNLLSDNAKLKVKMKVMSAKIASAFTETKRRTYDSRKIWKETKKVIPNRLLKGYLDVWRKHMKKCEKAVAEKHNKKIAWLESKWSKAEPVIPEVLRDVRIADDDLPEEFESSPRVYGGVQLDEDEKAALALSPKYGLYRALRVEQTKIDVEEALNKLRWNAILMKSKRGIGGSTGSGGCQVRVWGPKGARVANGKMLLLNQSLWTG